MTQMERRDRLHGRLRCPEVSEVQELAASQYIRLSANEAESYIDQIWNILSEIDQINDLEIPSVPVRYPEREIGEPSDNESDPFNVYIRRCLVRGSESGKLSGKRVGLKDNIKLAGVPMTNGSRLMDGYVPSMDATVVERILDAGGTIVGKLNMDSFSFGAGGESSEFGPARNPHDPAYSAGGSSSGSAAAVAAGEVDIALGVDQGGSARIPAAWCGVVSMKATHGLVPSFGIAYVDHTLDHVCPIASTVKDTALALEVLAGEDPRSPVSVRVPYESQAYSQGLGEKGVGNLRIGVLKESMDWLDGESDVNSSVRDAVEGLRDQGAEVQEISLPWWKQCESVILAIMTHSLAAMVDSDLEGYSRPGMCDPGWQNLFGKARRASGRLLSPLLIVHLILAKYLQREYCSTYFSKAQNLRHFWSQQLDDTFKEYDVLVTPTTPMKAVRLPTVEESEVGQAKQRGLFRNNLNTCPANLTGHPAITVPCGTGDNGLPIGLQIIGRRFDEGLLFNAAFEVEKAANDRSSGADV